MISQRSNLRAKFETELARLEVLDDAVADILRRKSRAERIAMCCAANRGFAS